MRTGTPGFSNRDWGRSMHIFCSAVSVAHGAGAGPIRFAESLLNDSVDITHPRTKAKIPVFPLLLLRYPLRPTATSSLVD